MTKLRPPVSFYDAVTRIAGRIGWDGCASVTGKAERTVRNWSDPDTGAVPSIEDAFRLDAAYRAAGGGEAPIMSVYALKLDREAAQAADAEELAAATAVFAKEGGEAMAAMVLASRPGASERDRQIALKEGEEAIGALTNAMHKLGGSK